MYTIRIDYRTGNSFGSQEETSEVGCEWETQEAAKEALKCIKEHDKYFANKRVYSWNQVEFSKDYLKSKYWHAPNKYDEEGEMSLKVKLDDGTLFGIHCFWVGYFERLLCAEVIAVEDEDLIYRP